jgi:hypothetical protein
MVTTGLFSVQRHVSLDGALLLRCLLSLFPGDLVALLLSATADSVLMSAMVGRAFSRMRV